MELLLIRHGETEESKKGILLGHKHGKLSYTGIMQSKSLAISLKNEDIDAIYSSDLKRALQTSEYIKEFHPDSAFYVDRRLRERNYGIYNGSNFESFLIEYKDENLTSKPKNGESLLELRKRLEDFYTDIIKIYPKDCTLALISHANSILELIKITSNVTIGLERDDIPKNASLKRVFI